MPCPSSSESAAESKARPIPTSLKVAQQTQDFEAACRALKTLFTATGAQLARECSRRQVGYDPDFWPECAQRAERARVLHAAARKQAKERAARTMREEGLHDFADALESGDYAALRF